MISSPISRLFRLLGLWCYCCLLVACNRNPEPAAPAATPTRAAKSSAHKSEADPLAGMVKAVAADAGQQPIELRFELAARPQVGEAVEVKLNLLGLADATDVKFSASTDPKMTIVSGGEASFGSLKAGESMDHTVALRGTGTGIFIVDIKLMATVNGVARALSYAIPVALLPAASEGAETASAATPAAH